MLDDHAHRALEHVAVDVLGAEQQQRARPVDRLRDRRRLLEVEVAHHVHDLHELARHVLGEVGGVQAHDLQLALDVRVVEPQVEAAALERLGQLARVVRGEQHERVGLGLDHAQLGDRDLEVRQDLEQHRLELLVGLVDLVDQQHHRLLRGDRREQGAGEQELLAEDVVLAPPASRRRRPRPGSAAAACGSSTRTAPWPRRAPRSTAGAPACGRWRGRWPWPARSCPLPPGPPPAPACRGARPGRTPARWTRPPGSRRPRGRRGSPRSRRSRCSREKDTV